MKWTVLHLICRRDALVDAKHAVGRHISHMPVRCHSPKHAYNVALFSLPNKEGSVYLYATDSARWVRIRTESLNTTVAVSS